jgi:hypothetical protein
MKPGIAQMPECDGPHDMSPRLPGALVNPADSIHHGSSII